MDIAELVQIHSAKLREMQEENRDPTQDEWDELNDLIKHLQGQLHLEKD